MKIKFPEKAKHNEIRDISEVTISQLFSPSEIYHENSKMHPSDMVLYSWINLVNTSPHIRNIISRPFTHYKGYPSIRLPHEFAPTSCTLEEAIVNRRSVREFSGLPMHLNTLAKILYLGDTVVKFQQNQDGTTWSLRTAPSAGGLYPIDMYCAIINVNNLKSGIYFYNPLSHCLEQLIEMDVSQTLIRAIGSSMERTVKQACACIIITAVMSRIKFKYGERAYRFIMLEAGHIAQNLLLAAQGERVGAVPIGGFLDDEVNHILRFDGVEETTLYLVLLGSL
jgi:SagB-type dehydrogenase family enzyme